MAAWWLDDCRSVFEARERSFRLYSQRADRRGAGRVAITLAEDNFHFRGDTAVAKGWHARANRLLAGLPAIPEQGWLKLWEGDLLLALAGEPSRVRELAAEAAATGRVLGEIDLEMTGLALEGLALVSEGALADGMPRLDEATTAAVSGEMRDALAIGLSCCYLVTACERIRDFERAAQWCRRVEEFALRSGFNAMLGVCRAQYAGVLVFRGAWAEAELELEGAIGKLRTARPAMQSEGLLRLANLRRMQGQFAEASRLLAGLEGHAQALLGRAALALDTGDDTSAIQLAERFLRGTPRLSRTERVAALEVLYRARLASGSVKLADAALTELREIASVIPTPPLRAAALSAEGLGRAAAADHEGARRAFEDAIDLYGPSAGRYEQACVRVELGTALRALGEDERARTELEVAQRCFTELGAAWRALRVAKLLQVKARVPASGQALAPSGLTRREIEVLKLVALGLSNRGIGERLFVSELTIKRHVANLLLKLELPSRAAAAAYAAKSGLV